MRWQSGIGSSFLVLKMIGVAGSYPGIKADSNCIPEKTGQLKRSLCPYTANNGKMRQKRLFFLKNITKRNHYVNNDISNPATILKSIAPGDFQAVSRGKRHGCPSYNQKRSMALYYSFYEFDIFPIFN